MKDLVKKYFKNYNIDVTELQAEKFAKFYHFLVAENEKFNLTAITQPDEVAIKHFVDSVLPFMQIPKGACVIDVGTGGGFPGVPLKIMRDDIQIVLLDSLQKRVKFLEEVKNLLSLSKTTCVHSRAEDYVKNNREKFDVALSRAVAGVPTLSEYLLPYVKVGGKIMMYKGSKAEEELFEGQKAIKEFGGKFEKMLSFKLNEVESERNIIIINKVAHTNQKYPRGKNLPKTQPII